MIFETNEMENMLKEIDDEIRLKEYHKFINELVEKTRSGELTWYGVRHASCDWTFTASLNNIPILYWYDFGYQKLTYGDVIIDHRDYDMRKLTYAIFDVIKSRGELV